MFFMTPCCTHLQLHYEHQTTTVVPQRQHFILGHRNKLSGAKQGLQCGYGMMTVLLQVKTCAFKTNVNLVMLGSSVAIVPQFGLLAPNVLPQRVTVALSILTQEPRKGLLN